MRRISSLLLLSLLAFVGSVEAHGGGAHVMGIVTTVDASHVEVKTEEGKIVTAHLTGETKYMKGTTPANAADLKAGLRVVLHLAGEGKDQWVREVHLPAGK